VFTTPNPNAGSNKQQVGKAAGWVQADLCWDHATQKFKTVLCVKV
jgi:hypothetical protein